MKFWKKIKYVFGGMKRPVWKLGRDLIPFASLPPCLPMQSRDVQCVAFTPVPQEPSVNLKAPTSGYSLALFALSSAHRGRPPWLWIQGWPSFLYSWPGEVKGLCTHLVWGWSPLHFQLTNIFVSVTPFRRDSCRGRHTFIILSFVYSPCSGHRLYTSNVKVTSLQWHPKHAAFQNRTFWIRCVPWQFALQIPLFSFITDIPRNELLAQCYKLREKHRTEASQSVIKWEHYPEYINTKGW